MVKKKNGNPKTYKVNNRLTKSIADATVAIKKRTAWKYLLLPSIVYFLIFFILQPQYISVFSSAFFLDSGDGFQNVWNIWWVDEALVDRHINPYFTDAVHWPHGTTLIPQTLNIFNAIIAIPLMNLFGFSLVQATNTMVVFSFVFSGVTMLWFIFKLYRNYLVAFIAGALYTFSTYHFAHAQGHLQLVSFEFIPLFLLSFTLLLEKLRYRYAIFAAVSLFLVLLCDYYYLFWSVIVGGMYFLWMIYRKELHLTKQTVKVLGVFSAASIVLIGPLALKLVTLNKKDPLLGFHDPVMFSLDPLSVFIPGGSWKWSSITVDHWGKLSFSSETSVFFGIALLTVLSVMFVRLLLKKKFEEQPDFLYFWWIILFMFAILALGRRLTINGRTLDSVPLPYELLEKLFPTLEISGLPVRWVLVSLIAAIVIVSYALTKINTNTRKGQVLMVVFVGVSIIDLYPKPLPVTYSETKKYVTILKYLPKGAVIDNAAKSGGEQLYNQTVHEKPMAFGYVTRLPQSVDQKSFLIFAALEEHRHEELCQKYRVRYVTTPSFRPLETSFPSIYQDNEAIIYDMKNSENCVN